MRTCHVLHKPNGKIICRKDVSPLLGITWLGGVYAEWALLEHTVKNLSLSVAPCAAPRTEGIIRHAVFVQVVFPDLVTFLFLVDKFFSTKVNWIRQALSGA